jgi:hypothetical protein
MFDYKKSFDDLLASRNGIEVDSIHFVTDEIYIKDEKQTLAHIGLESYVPILFTVKGTPYPAGMGMHSSKNLRGKNICAWKESKIKHVIILPEEVLKGTKHNSEAQDELRFLLQLCALLHELGHVEDMQKSINFSFGDKPTVKILEAEAYAHIYTLNHLNRAGATIARNMLADALYKLNQSNKKFDRNLYKQICASIGKGRVKKWTKA